MNRLIAAAALIAFAAPALAQPNESYIITSDGHYCPAERICSPVDAGDNSKAYLHVADPKEGFGYIAIQFGDTPPTSGFLQFFLSAAPGVQQFCAFSPGHTNQGYEWPIASQIEWWSSQAIGMQFATTLKFRAQDLVPNGTYAFTFDCSVKATNP
jgi:hypothetical protein